MSKRKRAKGGRPAPGAARNRGKAAAGQRQASPSILLAAAVITALLAVGFVLAVKLTTGSSDVKPPPAGVALPGAEDVRHLLKGIPQSGNVLGSPTAPVTLIEYVDLQCPFCQEFETQAMPTLLSRYVRSGKLKVEARPVAIRGADSVRGQSAAIAAGLQNKMFNFMQLLYDNQGVENSGWLNDSIVRSAAVSIPGLDVGQFVKDVNSSAVDDQVKALDDQATADALAGTPTILVGKAGTEPRQVALTAANDPSPVAAAVDAALR